MQRFANGRSVREMASEFLENSREFTKERASQAKGFIRAKPILSAFLGLGAGLMVGLLFSRRTPKIEVVVFSKGKSS